MFEQPTSRELVIYTGQAIFGLGFLFFAAAAFSPGVRIIAGLLSLICLSGLIWLAFKL